MWPAGLPSFLGCLWLGTGPSGPSSPRRGLRGLPPRSPRLEVPGPGEAKTGNQVLALDFAAFARASQLPCASASPHRSLPGELVNHHHLQLPSCTSESPAKQGLGSVVNPCSMPFVSPALLGRRHLQILQARMPASRQRLRGIVRDSASSASETGLGRQAHTKPSQSHERLARPPGGLMCPSCITAAVLTSILQCKYQN
jgi:ribosomal protein L34E